MIAYQQEGCAQAAKQEKHVKTGLILQDFFLFSQTSEPCRSISNAKNDCLKLIKLRVATSEIKTKEKKCKKVSNKG